MKQVALPSSPTELLSVLGAIYPEFIAFAEQEPLAGYEVEPLTYHYLMSEFAVFFGREAASSTQRQLQQLTEFLARAVETDGVLENVVSTCFLEHARQLKVNRMLRPLLSKKAVRRGA